MTPNQQKFADLYRTALKEAVTAQPNSYGFTPEQTDQVADRMLASVQKGTFNKEGTAFKSVCKQLAIKHTYQAINRFWSS